MAQQSMRCRQSGGSCATLRDRHQRLKITDTAGVFWALDHSALVTAVMLLQGVQTDVLMYYHHTSDCNSMAARQHTAGRMASSSKHDCKVLRAYDIASTVGLCSRLLPRSASMQLSCVMTPSM